MNNLLNHKEVFFLYVLHLSWLPVWQCFVGVGWGGRGVDAHKFLMIMTKFSVILSHVVFSIECEGFRESIIIRLKALCHIYTQVDQLSMEVSRNCAHPCFNVVWKFYLRVWYMQFRPQNMVSEKYGFESEGSGNLDRKHE